MRVSGKGMAEHDARMLGGYTRSCEGGFEIDLGSISEAVKQYIEEAAAADKYSISGLCIALGITRQTLELWRAGYVCEADAQHKRAAPNAELSQCVAKGELYVHRYWEESDKSTTLHTKFLENAGLLAVAKQTAGRKTAFDLGRLKKYCR